MDSCCRFIVHGRVQGVFFRASTRRTAVSLGIYGHAVNLPDGTVEVLACGDAVAVQKLADWLHHGPPKAQVTRVEKTVLSGSDCEVAAQFRCG